ncbi:MAG: hypothetical protein ACLTSZ_07560 [Lachnospiraceae bacterium]
MILFKKTPTPDGLINLMLVLFGVQARKNFIDGPYWQANVCSVLYTIWVVMPFKILILTAPARHDQSYHNAARVDGNVAISVFHGLRS